MTRTPRRHFPQVLHEILRDAPPSIVAWNSQGTAFQIKHRQRFIEQVLPKHPQKMRISKYKSFVRQLNLWGFACLRTTDASGRKIGSSERGFYYHTHFRRDEPHLCRHIHRVTRAGKVPAAGGDAPLAAPTSANTNTTADATTNRSRVSSISTSTSSSSSSNASAASSSSSSSDFSGIYREEDEETTLMHSENERIMLHAMESFHRERSDSYSPISMTNNDSHQSPSSDLRPLGPKPWFPTVPVGSAVTVAATATVTPSLTSKVGVKMESLPVAPDLQPQQRQNDRLGRPVSPSGWSIGTFQDDDDDDIMMADKDARRVVSSDTANLRDIPPETQHAVQQADQWTSAVLTPNNSNSKLTQAFDSQPCSSGFRHFEQSNVEQMALYQVWNRLESDEGTSSSGIPHSVVPGVSTQYANPFTT